MKLPSLGDLSESAKRIMVIAPRVFGAGTGLFIRPYSNWISPVEGFVEGLEHIGHGELGKAMDHWKRGFGSGVLSYTSYRPDTGKMDLEHAIGLKAGLVGFIVSEIVEWIVD